MTRALVLHLLFALSTASPASVVGSEGERPELPTELAECLHQANLANAVLDLERERSLLVHAESLSGRPQDVAKVQRQLAVLDWKYELEDDQARERLRRAASADEPARALLALARLEAERDRFAEARSAAAEALAVATKGEVQRNAQISMALASAGEASLRRRRGEPLDLAALGQAHEAMLAMVRAETGVLGPSKILLRTAILLRDGPAALLAWRSYYHVGADGLAPNGVAAAGAELERLLPLFGTEQLTAARHLALVEALRASHFHQAAAVLACDPSLDDEQRGDPRVRTALAYADFSSDLRRRTDEYYRRCALGRARPQQLDILLSEAIRDLHRALDEPGRLPSRLEKRWDWLAERFGVQGNTGITSGTYDLHMGHIVVDETRPVTQYGETANLRYVALDHMISNGFQSWAWETGAEHGGWAGPDTMWQVRPLYADSVIHGWRQMHDETARAAILELIERESLLDEQRARANPIAHLPGLLGRLRLQASEAVLADLRGRGLRDEALRDAFIQETGRAILEHSIFAHEGRHAIDNRLGEFDVATLEYRAKLAQVAFAPQPRLAVDGIISPVTGDPTPHGQANARALEGLLRWIEQHAGEIEGLDRERPLLPQLDQLSDDQLRAAFRSMDPLARAE